MIEKLLRRFVSEDTKIILEAVKKWTEDRDMLATPESNRMIADYLKVCPRIDRAVIVISYKRGNRERIKDNMRKNALDTAAKILMGEKFEKTIVDMGQTIGGSGAQSIAQQAQVQAQAMHNAQNAAYNQMAMQNSMMSNAANQMAAVPLYAQTAPYSDINS